MATPTPPNPNAGQPKSNSKSNLPSSDSDFSSVITEVQKKWATETWLTLQWIDFTEFTQYVTDYNTKLGERQSSGGTRPQITKQLKNTDKEINESLNYVKDYLAEKYGKKNATSYYSDFGIVHRKDTYEIPKDHNNRKDALVLLVAAITTHGFQTKTYGLAYWTALQTKYNDLLAQSYQTDETISTKVGSKNELKKALRKALNSIVLVIKANYPDTYKTELRAWGFQKEKY